MWQMETANGRTITVQRMTDEVSTAWLWMVVDTHGNSIEGIRGSKQDAIKAGKSNANWNIKR